MKKRRVDKPMVVLDAPLEPDNVRNGSLSIGTEKALISVPDGETQFVDYKATRTDLDEYVLIFDGKKGFTIRKIVLEVQARERSDKGAEDDHEIVFDDDFLKVDLALDFNSAFDIFD